MIPVKGRKYTPPKQQPAKVSGLYAEKGKRQKNKSLLDQQVKDELEVFKKLDLNSSRDRGRNQQKMDVDRSNKDLSP